MDDLLQDLEEEKDHQSGDEQGLEGCQQGDHNTHTKQNFYQAGSSVTLDKEFYHGDTFSSKEIELRAEEMFFAGSRKGKGVACRIKDAVGSVKDKITSSSDILLVNNSKTNLSLLYVTKLRLTIRDMKAT